MNRSQEVDSYINSSADFAKPILNHLRDLVHNSCPDVVEVIKWGFPNFEYKGQILCSLSAFKKHCSFGFWLGNEMEDPDSILQQIGKTAMGHLGQLKSSNDLPSDEIITKYITQAMKLSEVGKKKNKLSAEIKRNSISVTPEVPEYFQQILEQEPEAKLNFEKFSNSCKREYIDWIVEAKTEKTRVKRMNEAIELLKEAKQRNWKYQK
jgi:uncharacterized protein YdeI (YjbR/CyaY-like superfamily)